MRLRFSFSQFSLLLSLYVSFIYLGTNGMAQLNPQEAGYIDAIADYGAINDGLTVTTASLQAALDAAIAQDKALYLPPGEYLIDGTILAWDEPEIRDDQTVVIQGSSIDPDNRSTLVLKEGTFPDPNDPKAMVYSYSERRGYTDVVNRSIQSVDFKIQANNAGAVGLDWRGAEGCSIFDIHMDMTGGFAGFLQLPGSGGSLANASVIGGRSGIDLRSSELSGGGTQPTPVITAVKFEAQTEAAIITSWNRGTITLVGCEFSLNANIPAVLCLTRHRTWRFSYGGNLAFTDCTINYQEESNGNVVVIFDNKNWPVSVYGHNVYVNQATHLISEFNPIAANSGGWRHFTEFAFSSGIREMPNGTQYEPIYIEGIRQDDIFTDFEDDVSPTESMFDRHNWGPTFPSFESPGAINLATFSPDGEDWAPALQSALDQAAATESGVVFVPPGNYDMYSGVTMPKNTHIIGVSHHQSHIRARDTKERRYANSAEDPYTPTPLIQTVDDPTSANILADIWVQSYGSLGRHDPTPNSRMALLWRAGNNSVIRNIHYKTSNNTNFRANFVAKFTYERDQWLNLKSIPSPSIIDGFSFTSESATKFFSFDETESRILAETVNGSRRLLTRSIPFNNKADIEFSESNLTIEKDNGQTFALNSLEVFSGAMNPNRSADIQIEVFTGNTSEIFIVNLSEEPTPRDEAQLVEINRENVSQVLITSPRMFAIDQLAVDGKIIDFEQVTGETIELGRDMQPAIYYDGYRDLHLGYQNHPMVKVTGGVKWYNHWIHGDVWMDPHLPYISVENNTGIVSFYHFHVQHSQNDVKVLLNKAKNVSVFGVKTEQSGIVGKAVDSDNIRFVGHGGLTSAIPGSALYWIENSTNYVVSSPTDELDAQDICQFCGSGSAILPQAEYGTYEILKDVKGQTILTPGSLERPILWKSGNFTDPWENAIQGGPITSIEQEIGDLAEEGFNITIFPNPSTSELVHIQASEKSHIQIFDITGKILKEVKGKSSFSFEPVATGVYLVKASNGDQTITKKFISK